MPKKANQEELPGLERRDVPEIEQAADRYRRIRDERCELSKQEGEAKAALIQVMKNKGRQFYSYNGLNVQLSNQENVKVKAKDEDDEEPVGTFTQRSRHPKIDTSPASEFIAEIDAEEEAQLEAGEEERERLHKEAIANWRRERPASTETADEDDETDYQDEWRASLNAEERERYNNAPCRCGHSRDLHDGDDSTGECTALNCGLTAPTPRCQGYHCLACDTKGGHQATCEHYVLGEGTPVQKADDFTAPRCDECGRIDGGHTQECPKSNALRFVDYLAYAKVHYNRSHQSHARKMELSKQMDDKVRDWKMRHPESAASIIEELKQQQAGDRPGNEPEPKKRKSKKLSPVEAAIDR